MDNWAVPSLGQHAMAATRARIAGHVRRTPLVSVAGPDLGLGGGPVWLKLENLQLSGTFKIRAAMAGLTLPAASGRAVAVASRGHWGVAAACASSRLGRTARIFVPDGVAKPRVARMRGYGAEIVAGGREAAVLSAKAAWCAASGALALRGDDDASLLGAATIGVEIAEDAPLDVLLVPVGSAGLIAGLALWRRVAGATAPRLIGVEPMRAPTLSRAIAAGAPVAVAPSGIAADTLGATRVSQRVLSIAGPEVSAMVLVSDRAIVAAQMSLWSALRLGVEPAAAVGLAALQSGMAPIEPGERGGIVVTGANIAAPDLGH